MTAAYLEQVEQARRRYEDRTRVRQDTLGVLDRRGVLHADTPERVTRRLARLGVDWTMASALEQAPPGSTTGRSLGAAMAPGTFGAGLLHLERLMGRNDLIDVGFLEAGQLAAHPVGRVVVRGRDAHFGTGFLISPEVMLTNNHVLGGEEEAAGGVIEFDFQSGVDGRPLLPVTFALEPARFFATDPALDFTAVAVAPRGKGGRALDAYAWLPLTGAQGTAVLGEFVNIVQHPGGEPKQVALRENKIVDVLDRFVHYETDTSPGSSGSPVFNDQWEVVALHHASVPVTDAAGGYLATDGGSWTPEMGEQRLAWKANEGVRISRVLRALRGLPLTGEGARLRDRILEGAELPQGRTPAAPPGGTAPPAEQAPGSRSAGTVRLTVPLEVTVGLSVPAPAGPPFTAAPDGATGQDGAESPELRAALADLEAARALPYYDTRADAVEREAYYSGIGDQVGADLTGALTRLLETTHERRPAYKPMRLVYPWVDLHPDGVLRSIYSGLTFSAEELIRADAAVEAARAARWQALLRRESTLDPERLAAESALLEAALPYNCEHVVPQSWFGKAEPMRGDLHHLFACESGCNSFRGNTPYFDFAEPEEAVRHACGRREADRFEPAAGKGPVARATLYFLLRYPGQVGDADRELRAERLGMLLDWHARDPVGDYERHRNQAVARIQGNRNPLVDHPEWSSRMAFPGLWARTG